MTTRDRRYRAIGVVLCAVGGALLALALAQELFGVAIFGESPVLVGTAVGFIGALLVTGARRGAAGRPGGYTPPGS